MKIMHVVEGFGGGVYSFLEDLCNSLSEYNEIVLVYSRRDQTPDRFEEDFCKNIKIINLQMQRKINFFDDAKNFFKLLNIIKNEKPDILHLHSSKAGVLGRISGKILGYKNWNMFYNPHGYAFLQENISYLKRTLYSVIERTMFLFGGTTIAVSKGEYLEGKKITKNIVRIDNSIDDDELKEIVKESKYSNIPVIGTIGRITYQKNPELFNKIAQEFPKLTFIWIGDGELKSKLTSKNIYVTGWKKRYEAIKLMNKLDIYLQTSLWEGLPIALLEAMYMGKPAIVNDVIGNRDVIIHNYNGFTSRSVDEYKKYINMLIGDREVYESVSNNSKKYIEDNHLLKDMVQKYNELYSMGVRYRTIENFPVEL
ncbi:glycosyltransferase [Clostridium intestinale]|uniref:Glycoside hydrolase n=1 Tax=Clostridium intestinale URNW TaxID=1294142 RepID=U2Q7M5_9CLOT|nr:glycosyltransferase [Clostridium intestinale]ERK32159.1 glycoside hydrolase [Clostridium intestinale URNW]